MAKLISFDIDGTLEVGDPPGMITLNMVRKAKDLGYLIGSCSDRPLSHQRQLWETHKITVDFVSLKQHLAEVRSRFQAEVYYHIGDTDLDGFFAAGAGFHFIRVDGTARDFPLPLGEGQGEGGFEPVQPFDFPHPRPLPAREGT